MNTPTAATPAKVLLDLVLPTNAQPTPTDAMAEKAIADFIADIKALDLQHNRRKILTQDQLAEQVFRRNPTFKDDRATTAYLRYQLRVALEEMTSLVQEIRNQNNETITFDALTTYSSIVRDYLFDMRDILAFLQRNVPNWIFFWGGKNSGVSSWEVYNLARDLAFQSTYRGTGAPFEHKAAQIASIFVLRQAMELRFERLIAVYPTDTKDNSPKLKHGFHQEFIAANPQFFQTNGFQIKKLRHLYDWCSEIVHQAYQPYAWQISMAMRRGGDLLRAQKAPANQSWSIFNAVRINDVKAMQDAYEHHFLTTYGHGCWRFTRTKPEALIVNWQPEMAFTSETFRPVFSHPST